ncbi:hypothetical protein [Heyndrickxia acidicola]|uniref:Uncharacterized protein n=1 Tax=Heyndrickxia acidicola TaxID=209389 RepID=A0ABU6MH61_9BACI|nr:hypothetical protein [Heyndrickxia acidicola]MED1204012.1 hypothetical protein [Heyndrickxia acidicola]
MFKGKVINQLDFHFNKDFDQLTHTADKRIRLCIVFQFLAKNKPFMKNNFNLL